MNGPRRRLHRPAWSACAASLLGATLCLAATTPRVEARSAELLAVGIIDGDRMSIHLSRPFDNAPVRGAVLTVMLRGVAHPTVAQADGSYSLQTPDLTLPGAAVVEFLVGEGAARAELKGELVVDAPTPKRDDSNSVRQLGWWVLNFGVCIAFLMLWSKRRKLSSRE